MNVVFMATPVHPQYDTDNMKWAPHYALYYLSHIIKEHGIRVNVIDPQYIRNSNYFKSENDANKTIVTILSANHYDAVLFSATTLTWGITRDFIKRFKSIDKNIKVIIGGIHASHFPDIYWNLHRLILLYLVKAKNQ